MLTERSLHLVATVALAVIALVALHLAARVTRILGVINAVLRQGPEQRLASMAKANNALVSTPEGLGALFQYSLSEAAVHATIEDMLKFVASLETEPEVEEAFRRYMDQVDTPFWKKGNAKKAAEWVRVNWKELAGKLFGKVNEILKDALHIGGSKKK